MSTEFRAWKESEQKMIYWNELCKKPEQVIDALNGVYLKSVMQFTGIRSADRRMIFIKDICQFPNGDSFVVEIEEWLEIYADWLGNPQCEDLADCKYWSRSRVIGNTFEHKYLLPKQRK